MRPQSQGHQFDDDVGKNRAGGCPGRTWAEFRAGESGTANCSGIKMPGKAGTAVSGEHFEGKHKHLDNARLSWYNVFPSPDPRKLWLYLKVERVEIIHWQKLNSMQEKRDECDQVPAIMCLESE